MKKFFVQITKVDAAKREITGIMTEQVTDKAKEKMHYASSKPYFQKWSDGIAKATGGKSLGNVRLMHQPTIGGKVTRLFFDDAAKSMEITTTPANDDVWDMIDGGFITGYSIGGSYVGKRWDDPDEPGVSFYTIDPCEVSYVDNPCLRTATFTMIKMDGSTEDRAFKSVIPDAPAVASNEEVAAKAEELAKATGGNWADFIEQAKADLVTANLEAFEAAKAAAAAEPEPDAENETGQEKAEAAAADGEQTDGNNPPADKGVDPEKADWGIDQVFKIRATGEVFATKAEAKAHVNASKTILKGASPLAAALMDALAKAAGGADAAPAVVFADPGYQADALKRWPLQSDLYIRAAWGLMAEPDVAAKYSAEHLAEVRGAIEKVWIDQIDAAGPPSVEKMTAFADIEKTMTAILGGMPQVTVAKGLWTVGETARIMDNFRYIVQSVGWEETYEGDAGSVLPSQGRAILAALGTFLVAMATEEVAEALAEIGVEMMPVPIYSGEGETVIIEAAARALDVVKSDTALIEKAGARNSKSDLEKLQGIHDHAVSMGATCEGAKAAESDVQKMSAERDDLQKAVEAALPEIQKLVTQVSDLTKTVEAQKAQIDKFGQEPEPMPTIPAGAAAVEKGAIDPASVAAMSAESILKTLLANMPKEQALDLVTRAALSNPMTPNMRGA